MAVLWLTFALRNDLVVPAGVCSVSILLNVAVAVRVRRVSRRAPKDAAGGRRHPP